MSFPATIAPATLETVIRGLALLFLTGACGDMTAAHYAASQQAQPVLAGAAMRGVVSDREGDIYPNWGRLPGVGFHGLIRVMSDRRLGRWGRGCRPAPQLSKSRNSHQKACLTKSVR
jgi:hypothetical protein